MLNTAVTGNLIIWAIIKYDIHDYLAQDDYYLVKKYEYFKWSLRGGAKNILTTKPD